MKFFEIFGIQPLRLNLSVEELENFYYKMALEIHPDRNTETEANEKSAALNEAYRTLKDPWKRAGYVVHSLSKKENASKKIPTALAELYFELQDAENYEAMAALKIELAEKSKLRDSALEEIFREYDKAEGAMKAGLLTKLEDLVHENSYAKSMARDLLAKESFAR